MENFDINKTSPDRGRDEPTPLNNTGSAGVSHSPLNLGGGGAANPLKIETPVQTEGQTTKKPVEATSLERVTGVRTFFTKLHAGAIEFQDEIIAKWLKDNPGIFVKHTNIITGEIQGKKTEPNLIITVWY
jgi:hypothetical protein